ncbi:hypothetical protein, partial [Roseisolibacter sp. H3M3-2]|uniref:hypothetical protein n=1 Tax=Roseisolibacter sp. H3M3-2 TaxID=3031323 RepID=UPI0023DC3683
MTTVPPPDRLHALPGADASARSAPSARLSRDAGVRKGGLVLVLVRLALFAAAGADARGGLAPLAVSILAG